MIIFLIILILLFLITSFFLLILLSNLEIEIDKFVFDSNNKKANKYLFYIKLKFIDKITWIKIKIDNKKINKVRNSKFFNMYISEKLNKTEIIKKIMKDNKKYKVKIRDIQKLDLNIKQLYLDMEIFLLDNIFTSFSVVTIASILSIILAKSVKRYKNNKYKYSINPIYGFKTSVKINLNCIINIKVIHIINMIYFIRKRSVKYYDRTSNSRTYVCNNE